MCLLGSFGHSRMHEGATLHSVGCLAVHGCMLLSEDRGTCVLHHDTLLCRPTLSGATCRKHFTLVESAHGGGAIANAQLTPSEVMPLCQQLGPLNKRKLAPIKPCAPLQPKCLLLQCRDFAHALWRCIWTGCSISQSTCNTTPSSCSGVPHASLPVNLQAVPRREFSFAFVRKCMRYCHTLRTTLHCNPLQR